MGTVTNLDGFFKAENSTYRKRVKSKGGRNRERYQKARLKVVKHFGLSDYATTTAICFCIHKETEWEMPGRLNRCKLMIKKFARKLSHPTRAKNKSAIKDFYQTRQWKELRFIALRLSDGSCQLCGAKASDGVQIHVDHIKPRSKHPELELDLDNVQILCADCNYGKSNYDDTDFRNW